MASQAGTNVNFGKGALAPFAINVIANMLVTDGGVGGLNFNPSCSVAAQSSATTGKASCTPIEADINAGDVDHGGDVYHDAASSVGVLVNGGGTKKNNAAFEVGGGPGSFSLWHEGLVFAQSSSATASAIASDTIHDETGSTFSYLDEGKHSFGFQLNGTYATTAFGSPNYRVDGSGNVARRTSSWAASVNLATRPRSRTTAATEPATLTTVRTPSASPWAEPTQPGVQPSTLAARSTAQPKP